jgi:hypothetical protein
MSMSGRLFNSFMVVATITAVVSLKTVDVKGQFRDRDPIPGTIDPGRSAKPTACTEVGNPAVFHTCAESKMKTFNPQRRTADGKPDMNGIWNPARGAMDIEEIFGQYGEGTNGNTPPMKSLIVDPVNGKIPYLPWALEIRKKIASYSQPTVDQVSDPKDLPYAFISPSAMCFQLGPMRTGYSGSVQLLQQPDQLIFFHGRVHTHRIIPLDGRPHLGKNIKTWEGDSRGRWEGNTLVIDTINTNGLSWFDHGGTYVTEDTRLAERLTYVDDNTIHYEMTVTDPKIFSQPWKIATAWQRSMQKQNEEWYDDSRENCEIGTQGQLHLGMKPYPGFWAIAPKGASQK